MDEIRLVWRWRYHPLEQGTTGVSMCGPVARVPSTFSEVLDTIASPVGSPGAEFMPK